MKEIKVEAYKQALPYEGAPDVSRIDYDGKLHILMDFGDNENPIYVVFDSPRGYRVLDEGDLLEFWEPASRADGWLWKIIKGGWLDLESTRSGFVSGLIGEYDEYLILGQNECVSVISNSPPVIFNKKIP